MRWFHPPYRQKVTLDWYLRVLREAFHFVVVSDVV